MAAPKVLQVWTPPEGVTGEVDISSGVSASGDIVYYVRFDQVHDDWELVYDADASAIDPPAAAGYDKKVPPLGDARRSYVLLRKQPKRLAEDPRVWQLTCSYKLPVPGQESKPDNPDIARWGVSVVINAIPYDYENQADAAGKAILNKARDPVSGVMTQRKMEEIVITFNCVEVDWIGLDSVFGVRGDGCVNSVEFRLVIKGQERVYAAGLVHWEDYSMAYTLDASGATYPQLVYRLRWRSDGWKRKIANKGFNQWISGKRVPILVGGVRISAPVYLKTDGSNQVIADPGDPVEDISADGLGTRLFDEFDIGAELLFDLNT